MPDFFNFSNELLAVADRRGYFTRVNRSWTRVLGWSAEELIARPYLDFVHPDDREATLAEARKLFTGGETVQFENRYLCRDGSYRWLAWYSVLEPESGELIATARDVTEERRREELLRESEERFRSLATHAPIGIAQADAVGNVFFVNQAWCDIAGVTPEQTYGLGWKNLIHPEDRAKLVDHWQNAVRAGVDMAPYEFRFVHADGEVRWALAEVAMLKGPDGRLTGQIGTLQDVTDRVVAEQRFRGIYEQAPLGIALIETGTGRFLHVNPKYEELLGRTEAEMRRLDIQSITPAEDFAEDRAKLTALLAGEIRGYTREKRMIRGDGSIIWVQLTAVPMWRSDEAPTYHLAIIDDVTVRRRTAEALRESEERYRTLVMHAPIGITNSDIEGNVSFANPKLCEIAGLKPEETLGLRWQNLVHPDDLPALMTHRQAALQAGTDMPPYEFRFIRGDGALRWASAATTALMGPDGRLVGQIGTLQDITDRVVAEQRFRNIFEQAPLGIGLLDSHSGRILHVNPKYEEILGRTEAELQQLDFQTVTYPEDLQEDLDHMARMLTGEIRRYSLEKRLIRGDGAVIWVHLTVVPMWRPDEAPTHHLAIIDDITERRSTAEALRKSEERLRLAMQATNDAIWDIDVDGGTVWWNEAYDANFGVRPKETAGSWDWWIEHIHPDDRERVVGAIRAAIEIGSPRWQADYRYRRVDGTYAEVLDRAFLAADPNGRIVRVVGSMLDVTNLRQAEREVRHREATIRKLFELQDQERRMLSHDIHDGLAQLLFGAFMQLESLRTTVTDQQVAGFLKSHELMSKAVLECRRLVNDLRPMIIEDEGITASIRHLIVDWARNTNCEIRLTSNLSTNRNTPLFDGAVFRIVQEAGANALRHGKPNTLSIMLDQDDSRMWILVEDDGVGFEPMKVPADRFGVRGIIERARLFGGTAKIDSRPGHGTKVEVKLVVPRWSETPPADGK